MRSMEQSRNSKMNPDRWDMDKVRYHLDNPPAPMREIKSVGDILKDVVGEQIAKHCEPGFIKDYALHVFVDHPGWLPELERLKRPLLMKLQNSYRELRIRHLRFSLQHR